MVLSVPSKTFLVGEYGVLKGGAALLVNTEPRFELRILSSSKSQCPFHLESPAGRLYKKHESQLKNLDFQFFDPHNERGGLGASSAQFALLSAFIHSIDGNDQVSELSDQFKVIESYRACSAADRGIPPSGYDVLSQRLGHVALIDLNHKIIESLNWRLNDLSFLILRTGAKIATHKHLCDLKNIDVSQLSQISQFSVESYLSQKSEAFLESIMLFQKTLSEKNLTCEKTAEILKAFEKNPLIRAAKGCGAMGGDMVIVFVDKTQKLLLRSQLEKDFEIIADETQISGGLSVVDEANAKHKTSVSGEVLQ